MNGQSYTSDHEAFESTCSRSPTHLLGFPIQGKLAESLESILVGRVVTRGRLHRVHSVPRLRLSRETSKIGVKPPSLMGVVGTIGGDGL